MQLRGHSTRPRHGAARRFAACFSSARSDRRGAAVLRVSPAEDPAGLPRRIGKLGPASVAPRRRTVFRDRESAGGDASSCLPGSRSRGSRQSRCGSPGW